MCDCDKKLEEMLDQLDVLRCGRCGARLLMGPAPEREDGE